MKLSLLILFLSSSVFASASKIEPKVIYGDDNRQDVYKSPRADLREVSDSTVAMIENRVLTNSSGKVKIDAESVGDSMGLCPEERFFQQPSGAMCSGFLVGDDLIATAGHCLDENSCADYSFAFGYKMADEKTAPDSLPEEDVYKCKEVIVREQTNNQDYALVKLDRPVKGHRVLQLARASSKTGDSVVVIGHPSGIPTKITDGAKVRSQKGAFFVANTDTYGGNSGSAVFDSQTLDVVGILVRGENDYVYDSKRSCRKSFKCKEDACRGEDITNIDWIAKAMAK